jgi:hypothetical protein
MDSYDIHICVVRRRVQDLEARRFLSLFNSQPRAKRNAVKSSPVRKVVPRCRLQWLSFGLTSTTEAPLRCLSMLASLEVREPAGYSASRKWNVRSKMPQSAFQNQRAEGLEAQNLSVKARELSIHHVCMCISACRAERCVYGKSRLDASSYTRATASLYDCGRITAKVPSSFTWKEASKNGIAI